jgi:hypothetical protein
VRGGPALAAVVGVLWVLFICVASPWRIAQRQKAVLSSPREITVSREGISIRMANANSQTGWDFFKRAINARHGYILLFAATKGSAYIPKRAFASPNDEQTFVELVREHLPDR